MKRRGEFMTQYEDEFRALAYKVDELHAVRDEVVNTWHTQQVVDKDSAYFKMRVADLEREQAALTKYVALADLRLAALAYVYDHDSSAATNYKPLETEESQAKQLELWQVAIDDLCHMSIDQFSGSMSKVLIETLDVCLDIEQTGQYGGAVQAAASYIKRIAGAVHDEGAATEARRNISRLLGNS
jgi:hypothetical protein